MASASDVCASCSGSFEDLKSAIKCNGCDKFFHGPCEGILNMKGFHMRRATWKCQKCVANDPVLMDGNPRKRHRSQNGDVVEIDRVELNFLMDTLKNLSETVASMKIKMDALYDQNKSLSDMVSTLLDKPQSRPDKNVSYAAITSKNSKRSTSARNVNKSSAVVHNNPDGQSTESPMETNENDGAFTPVKPVKSGRKRPLKSFIIGSREASSTEAENDSKFVGTERRQWIYVGRVSVGTTVENVIDHVKSNWNIQDVQCFQLVKRAELCSFKVGVKESLISSLLDASKWPKFVAVREFVQFPRRNSASANQNSGNFPATSQTDAGT